jgi:hypothetical protein
MGRLFQIQIAAQLGNMEPMRKFKQDSLDEATAMHESTLAALWDVFDENKDGVLSQEENSTLMRAYFDGLYKSGPAIVESLIKTGVEMGKSVLKQQLGGPIPKELEAKIDATIVPVLKNLRPAYINLIKTEYDNKESFEKVLKGMDTDNDGKVDKSEFIHKFISSVRIHARNTNHFIPNRCDSQCSQPPVTHSAFVFFLAACLDGDCARLGKTAAEASESHLHANQR